MSSLSRCAGPTTGRFTGPETSKSGGNKPGLIPSKWPASFGSTPTQMSDGSSPTRRGRQQSLPIELQNLSPRPRAPSRRYSDNPHAYRACAVWRAVSHARRHRICRYPGQGPPGNLADTQQTVSDLVAAVPLRSERGGGKPSGDPLRARALRGARPVRWPRARGAHPDRRAGPSISISPMSTGVRSKSDRMVGG